MEICGIRNAAFIMLERTADSAFMRAVARAGLVDHTREDAVLDSGRNAMGPVGRNRW
jgi:hypothetical protein